MTINLNARVRVKLTPHGVKLYHQHYRQFDIWGLKPSALKDGDTYEGELWDFMNVFGQHIGMGFPDVLRSTNLEVVTP